MIRYYQEAIPSGRTIDSSERFLSDAAGAGRGVPTEAVIARRPRFGEAPFDPSKYWDYFPGTD